MLYKNSKVVVHSSDYDTNFDIVTGVLLGDTLAQRMSIDLKKNGFALKNIRSRWDTAETMTVADHTNDLVLLPNTSAQAEYLQHNLK